MADTGTDFLKRLTRLDALQKLDAAKKIDAGVAKWIDDTLKAGHSPEYVVDVLTASVKEARSTRKTA